MGHANQLAAAARGLVALTQRDAPRPVNAPARFAAPACKLVLHLPVGWPRQVEWKTLWDNVIGYYPTAQPRSA